MYSHRVRVLLGPFQVAVAVEIGHREKILVRRPNLKALIQTAQDGQVPYILFFDVGTAQQKNKLVRSGIVGSVADVS